MELFYRKISRYMLLMLLPGVLLSCASDRDTTTAGKPKGRSQVTLAGQTSAIKLTEEGVKYLVHPSKLLAGGPPKDGIPSIDQPRFIPAAEADIWLPDNELVVVFTGKGVKRVYPLQILVWHEIVNDTVGEDPLLITYCPLCGSVIAFERRVQGESVEFGTTGKLYNSNLVMYDRKTGTYWTQVEGRAIVGELTGQKLNPVSVDTVVWGDWKGFHPDAQVLSRDTGFSRPYGRDPYGNYYRVEELMFPVEHQDRSLHPKTVVFGIEIDGIYKAYREEDVLALNPITDRVNGVELRIERGPGGVVKVVNLANGRAIVKERDFWFAWYAFHPDTLVYERP